MKVKKLISILFLVIFFRIGFSQEKRLIDSINGITIQNVSISQDSLVHLFQKNIKDSDSLNYVKGKADALAKLSVVFYYQGNYKENVSLVLEAINLYETLELYSKIAFNYGELGYQMKRRDFKKAHFYMQKGKKLAELYKDEDVLKDLYNNYGVLKEMNNELDSALYFYKKSLVIKEKQGDHFDIPYSESNIGGVYFLKKDYKRALIQFEKSIDKRIELNDSIGISENITQIAEVYLNEEKYYKAIEMFKKSNRIASKKEYKFLIQYNYKNIAEAFKKLNIVDSAFYYYEEYILIKDSITSLNVEKEIASLTIEFETEKKEKEILQQRAQLAEKELEVRKKNYVIYGSLGLALILGLIGYLVYNQQKLKNQQLQKESELKTALARIEIQNRLQEQRLRISRDLHDNIGSQLTFIISSIDNLKYGFKDMGEKLSDKLQGISSFTTQTIYELRDTIWAMNKSSITFEDLQSRITNFIDNAKIASEETKFSFLIAKEVSQENTFTSVQGMNIYRIIQEGVNNAIKYANASEVEVKISESNGFHINISDNGIGFAEDKIELGNGIINMKKRARDLKGSIDIISEEKKGTTIRVAIPESKD